MANKVITKKSWIGGLGRVLARMFLLLNTLLVVYPLLWNIVSSFKTNKEILTSPWTLPAGLAFDNYVRAFTKARMGEYALNSFFIVIVALAVLLFFSIPSAYILAKFKLKFLSIVRNTYMACLFIQISLILIPLFTMVNQLRLTDNRAVLAIIMGASAIPFSTFLLIGYIKGISREYEYAAMIDGCSYLAILTKIILPMVKPAIITITILNFFNFFNEYYLTFTLISSDEKKTLPVGMMNLYEIQRYATDWGALFAGLVIILIPTAIIYAFGQKTLTSGMSVGGLKG